MTQVVREPLSYLRLGCHHGSYSVNRRSRSGGFDKTSRVSIRRRMAELPVWLACDDVCELAGVEENPWLDEDSAKTSRQKP